MDDTFLQELVRQGPLVALLVFILWAGKRGVWTWGSQVTEAKSEREAAVERILAIHEQRLITKDTEHKEQMAACRDEIVLMRAERDEWKDLALKGLATAESAVLHAEVRQGEHQ